MMPIPDFIGDFKFILEKHEFKYNVNTISSGHDTWVSHRLESPKFDFVLRWKGGKLYAHNHKRIIRNSKDLDDFLNAQIVSITVES